MNSIKTFCKRPQFLIYITLLLLSAPIFSADIGTTRNGVLDLRGIPLSQTVQLSGAWQYQPGEFLSARQMQELPEAQKKYVMVPSRWNNKELYPENLQPFGCMTYYLKIHVDSDKKHQILGIRFNTISSAWRFYLNNELIVTRGIPTTTIDGFKADRSGYLSYFQCPCDTLHLILHVSNFKISNYSGIAQPIYIGTTAAIERHNFSNNAEIIFFSSAFFILITLHLLMFFIRNKERSHLMIAAISLFYLLKILSENEHILLKFTPWLCMEMVYKLWVLTIILFPLVICFTNKIFPDVISHKILGSLKVVFLLFVILIVFLPIEILTLFSHYLVVPAFLGLCYTIVALLKSRHQIRNDSLLYFIALLIMFVGFINDILYVTDIIRLKLTAHIGGLVFLAIQTWIVIARYSRSFEQEIILKHELETTNKTLEKTVNIRTDELQTAFLQLEKTNKNQDLLLTTISHDLMNIFNNLTYFTNDILHRSTLNAGQENDLRRVKNNADNGLTILTNILEWKSLQDNQKAKPTTVVHFSKLIDDQLQVLNEQIREKEIQISTDLHDEYHFECDYNQLHSIIRNILSNAVKFTPANGHISVRNRRDASMIAIEITDNGIGMPEWIVTNIFTLRKDKQRKGTLGENGSGIGLILTRELIENNRGSIEIISKTELGTTVTLRLPAVLTQITSETL